VRRYVRRANEYDDNDVRGDPVPGDRPDHLPAGGGTALLLTTQAQGIGRPNKGCTISLIQAANKADKIQNRF
jgi:hypothetical protein